MQNDILQRQPQMAELMSKEHGKEHGNHRVLHPLKHYFEGMEKTKQNIDYIKNWLNKMHFTSPLVDHMAT